MGIKPIVKRSLTYRAFAKLKTLVVGKVMDLVGRPGVYAEDIHLCCYTEAQKAAEKSLSESSPSPPTGVITKLLVIIPFRDKWEMTERCLVGLINQDLKGLEVQVALVDNGSTEVTTADGLRAMSSRLSAKDISVRNLRYETPFNFSYLNNQAMKDCASFNADTVAFVNNDIEFLESNSLQLLVAGTRLPNAGAVGCTLLYPNGLVQHLFVFVGSKIVGSHPFKGQRMHLEAKWFEKERAVGAVTGAVMFVKVDVFQKAGGFDEALPTSYQDVDLCLKFQKLGLVNWVVPKVLMIHHETQTRARETSWPEAELMEKKWGGFLYHNPFVSPVWSRDSEHFVFTPKALIRYMFAAEAADHIF
jgi:GT2 family glycosyltransferase